MRAVWLPLQVLFEYLDCSSVCVPITGGGCSVPFTTDEGIPMHFDPAWYDASALLARTCVRQEFVAPHLNSAAVFATLLEARTAGGPRVPQERQVNGVWSAL